MTAVLDIEDLRIGFGGVEAVRGIDLRVERGETHCLVGEFGLRQVGLRARGDAAAVAACPTDCTPHHL